MSMSPRADPIFLDEQACIAEIERLQRHGYTPAGAWTLPQACWHCWVLIKDAFKVPQSLELTAEQQKTRSFVDQINASGWPRERSASLPSAVPGVEVGEQAIADLIATLRTMASYRHSHVDHFILGPMEINRFRPFVLRHIAHHLAFLIPTVHRRPLRYADLDAMITDIARLRRGYSQGGSWSLAQIAWHINLAYPMPLKAEGSQTPLTEAQTARQARWDYYITNGKPPEGFQAPPELLPPATANEADIDALVQRLHDLKSFAGKFVHAAAGVMPIERARGFMLAHGAWHLSCLHPTHRKREGHFYASIAGIINDVRKLREGYVAAGNWTLEQVCWHLSATIPYPPQPGDTNEARTPELEQKKAFFEQLATKGPPPGFEAPAAITPPTKCEPATVDEFITKLEALDRFDAPLIQTIPFGAVPTARLKQLTLGHAARHLAFLRPLKGPREDLQFASENEAIADIERLRLGYEQRGGWSLPQVCWHLHKTVQNRLRPGPHDPDTPEQQARMPIVEQMLASGKLPQGIIAPEDLTPPADVGEEAIDVCIATLGQLRDHRGPLAPHRLFGTLPDDLARKQNLIHIAHHLSHLVPHDRQAARDVGLAGSKSLASQN